MTKLRVLAAPALLGLLGGCLDDKAPALSCGAGGDAFAYAGAGYCIYAGAIIIEGFDCPAMVPFEHQSGDVVVCAPSEEPPDGGWEQLITTWKQQRPGGGDTSAPDSAADTSPDSAIDTTESDTRGDAGPDTGEPPTSMCAEGLAPGACWDGSQCPTDWNCEGAAIACTPCVDCPTPISGTPGSCRPVSGQSALGLVAWPGFGGAEGGVPIALWWLDNAFYTLLECPSFALEVKDGAGGFSAGPSESACSGPTSLPSQVVIARPGPDVAIPGSALTVRARGRYRTDCFGSEPSSCGGEVELLSNEVTLPP